MSTKDRRAKPNFRIQRLERRVLLSATWADNTDANSELISPSLQNLNESPSVNEVSLQPNLEAAVIPSLNASSYLRFDRLTSEEVADLSNTPHHLFGPLAQINLETDFDTTSESPIESELASNSAQLNKHENSIRHELVLLDTGIHHYQLVLDDILKNTDPTRSIEVHLIDNQTEGWQQVSAILSQYEADTFDALHVISYGTDRAFKLGSTWNDVQSLGDKRQDIMVWGSVLNELGDILLYGCELAGAKRDLEYSTKSQTGLRQMLPLAPH